MTDQKILVIRFSSIGDIILATSPLKTIRNAHPDAQITFLTLDSFSTILEFHPDIDRLVTLDSNKSLNDLWWFADYIKEQQYFRIYDLHNSLRSNFILFKTNSEVRQVKKPRWNRFKLFQFHQDDFNPKFDTRFMYHSYLGDIWQVGDMMPTTYLRVTEQEKKRVKKKFELSELNIIIVPGAAWVQKQWSAQSYIELIEKMNQPVLLLGSKKDKICFDIAKSSPNVENLAGKTSLREALAILSIGNHIIGSDTGLIHAAEALNKPVTMILGPTSKKTGGGASLPDSFNVEKELWCRPCSQNGKRPCFRSKQYCMDTISVDDIYHTLLRND